MKREILFRGKRADNGEWVEGFFTMAEGDSYILRTKSINEGGIKDCFITVRIKVIPETVGQFTGVTGERGVKIFEDDIIERSLSGATPTTKELVYFHKCQFVTGGGDYIKPICNFYRLEVIGNIHDNPNLLE